MENKVKPNGKATVHANGKTVEMPVMLGTVGPTSSTSASCTPDGHVHLRSGLHLDRQLRSQITYIDGDAGMLLYRGYPIDQLAEQVELPRSLLPAALRRTADKPIRSRVSTHHAPHDAARAVDRFFEGFRRDAHPMAIMVRRCRRAVRLLSRQHRHRRSAAARGRQPSHDREDADDRRDGLQVLDRPAVRVYPRNDLDYASNFLRMCFAVPARTTR
jgi:citrate synthase